MSATAPTNVDDQLEPHIATTSAETIPYAPAVAPAAAGEPLPAWWPTHRVHPAFCLPGEHTDDDHPDDRVCWGSNGYVDLALSAPVATGDGTTRPEYLIVTPSQHVDETQPKLWLGLDESDVGRHLTVAEARQLAQRLLDATYEAEGARFGGGPAA
ncbi:hypothetical protein [Streptomyces synnematoformans]